MLFDSILINFYKKIKPAGRGWDTVKAIAKERNIHLEPSEEKLPLQLVSFVIGTVTVYSALFAMGNWIYGNTSTAILLTVITLAGTFFIIRNWRKI